MHLRRALMLFVLVLGLTALAASLAPSPDGEGPPAKPPRPSPAAAEAKSVSFRAPSDSRKPPVRRVTVGAPLILKVNPREGGQISIPKLGRTTNASPDVPVRFDLLGPEPGRYDVLFTATNGEPARVGTFVSAPVER